MIYIDGKFLTKDVTGVQRYANSLIYEFQQASFDFNIIHPENSFIGVRSKTVWEQLLPYEINNGLLFCPTNTGPIAYKNKILTLHDGAVLSHPEWFSKNFSRMRKFLIPILVNSSLKIITVSNFSKSHICEALKIKDDKVEVIYNGINTNKFKPMGISPKVLIKYNLKKPYILFVGSVEPRKNLTRMVNSWIRLPEIYKKEFDLIIVGKKNWIFKDVIIKKENSIKELGYIEDDELIRLYSMAKVFVYPSLFEGFGLPVLEAMACGTPVITSNSSALPEVGGEAVLYVDPKNEENITTKMIELLENESLQEELTIKGMSRSKLFSWKNTATKTIELFKRYM
jgi:glycosyltransferase involved in cell wall biosynthesis